MNKGEIKVDKEYILLNEIEKNQNITQRELSKKTAFSLGSVNILLNKMVHEGLVKIKQIPMNRVAYMLTPAGIAEKVRKTSDYIKIHYNYINETTKKIKNVLLKTIEQNGDICILLEQDEISELVKLAVSEIDNKKDVGVIEVIQNDRWNQTNDDDGENTAFYNIHIKDNKIIIAVSIQTYNELAQRQFRTVNLLELI
ncbi:MAG TPA: winged helix-turn-helix transcriptional regulator [Ruminiclostridium sp.]